MAGSRTPRTASLEPRRTPQQERGERRVSELLDAAAAEIAETGYEAATMSAIAARAGACIGSLYQFFPNKPSIAQALRIRYVQGLEEQWTPLTAEAKHLELKTLVNRLVATTIEFLREHPAFLALLDAPSSTRSPAAIRTMIQDRVAGLLLAQKPGMSREKARRLAIVTLQIMKTLSQLYAEVQPRERRPFIREFETLLFRYWSARMDPENSRDRK